MYKLKTNIRNTVIKKLFFCAFFFFLFKGVYAQTGPGGVGANDGSSNLRVWLLADDINADGDLSNNPTVGSRVSSWNDYSGNGNNYTNSGNNRPTYASGAFDAVNFNASLGTAQFLNGASGGTYTNGSTFFALNPVNSGQSNSLFDNTSYSLRVEQWSNTNSVGYTRYGVGDYVFSIAPPFGSNSIFSYHKSGGLNDITAFVNNSTNTISVFSSAAGIPYDRIGRNSSGSDEASGDFFEVILYNNRLNTAERLIVENYLSAKYGSIAIADNIYNEDESGNFDYKVAGIGQASDASNHTDSQGTGIVRINSPSNLQNNEFLFWGEDVENANYTFAAVAPANKRYRVNTKWRVSERGDVGTVTFSVNASDINLTGVPTGIFKLVRSTASDFSTIAEEYNLTLSGGVYSATVSFDDNDYFTLEMVPTVDLKLIKTVNNPIPKVGDVIVFTLSLTNVGPQDATGVVIRDRLPTGLTYAAGSSSITTGTYDAISGDWDLTAVTITAGGAPITIQIGATVGSQGVITNTTQVISINQEDLDSEPNNGN